MRDPSLSNKSVLDSETARTTVELMHMSIWPHGTLSMCGGERTMSAQAEERRETDYGLPVR